MQVSSSRAGRLPGDLIVVTVLKVDKDRSGTYGFAGV
jgi:hypothetical protein